MENKGEARWKRWRNVVGLGGGGEEGDSWRWANHGQLDACNGG